MEGFKIDLTTSCDTSSAATGHPHCFLEAVDVIMKVEPLDDDVSLENFTGDLPTVIKVEVEDEMDESGLCCKQQNQVKVEDMQDLDSHCLQEVQVKVEEIDESDSYNQEDQTMPHSSDAYANVRVKEEITDSSQSDLALDTVPREPIFTCGQCKELFYSIAVLMEHLKVAHKPEEQPNYQCEHCEKMFATSDLLNKHQTIHVSNNEEFVCARCDKVFVLESLLKTHVISMHYCSSCNTEHDYSCLYADHEEAGHCDRCCAEELTNTKLPYAMRSFEKRHRCNMCQTFFRTADFLEEHHLNVHCLIPTSVSYLSPPVVSVEVSDVYKCEKCYKEFEYECDLRQHYSFAHRNCPTCGENHNFVCPYLEHGQTKHCSRCCQSLLASASIFKCEKCEKVFQCESHLQRHSSKVHRLRDCPTCGEKHDYSCAEHKRMKHCSQCCLLATKQERKEAVLLGIYGCRVCNRKYFTAELLLEHQKTHGLDNSPVINGCIRHPSSVEMTVDENFQQPTINVIGGNNAGDDVPDAIEEGEKSHQTDDRERPAEEVSDIYMCDQCGETIEHESRFELHLSEHHSTVHLPSYQLLELHEDPRLREEPE